MTAEAGDGPGRRLSLERIYGPAHPHDTRRGIVALGSGLPLLLPRPGGGTTDDYVDELAKRLALLGIER